MRAGERKIASDGYEVCLFPCECMFLNVGRGEHDVYALDFRPVNAQGVRISKMPCYAPFTGTIVYSEVDRGDHNCVLESNNKVHTPMGLKYVRVLVAHQDAPAPPVTTEFRMGFKFYETGEHGYSFGEHLHMEYALVDNKTDPIWNPGTGIGLYGGIHMWEALYKDDTFVAQGGNYNWLLYGETPPVPGEDSKKKKKFPWVLYARKFRAGR